MKAGSVGSNPNDVTNDPSGPCQPLRDFLKSAGEAVFNLNTSVVGLDAVESGYRKPDSLNISWHPLDRKAAARKARQFVVASALVHVAEALSEFIEATAKMPRFAVVKGSWKGDTNRATKLINLSCAAIDSDQYLIWGGALVIHWRNKIIHKGSGATLNPNEKRSFLAAAAEIEQRYSGLSVIRILDDFEKNSPTLKDVSSLIAMSIRLCREIDATVKEISREELDALIEHYDLRSRITKVENESSPKKRRDSIVRMLQSTAPGLLEPYLQHYPL